MIRNSKKKGTASTRAFVTNSLIPMTRISRFFRSPDLPITGSPDLKPLLLGIVLTFVMVMTHLAMVVFFHHVLHHLIKLWLLVVS